MRAELFELLWRTVADVLGTAATATLIRRAARRAARRFPELSELSTTRDGREYRYTLPAGWATGGDAADAALRELVRELCALLVELTGPVVVQRLATEPALRALGIPPEQVT